MTLVFGGAPARAQADQFRLPTCDEIDPPYTAEAEDGDILLFCSGTRRYDPIQVYGDRVETDPGSYSALDAEAVFEVHADHPAEILNRLPGVNVQMNSGQEHLIAIRSPVLTGGAGQGSFLILENGVPVRSPAFGNVNSLLEPHHEVASAIEVVRGPGSAKYGSNAVHGLINVILPEVGQGSEAVASYGTLGRWRGDVTLDEGEHWLAALSLQKDIGWRDNTGIDQQKLTLMSDWTLGIWDATAWLTASNLNQETAGFIEGKDAYKDEDIARSNPNPEAYRDAWSVRAGARLSRPLNGGGLVLTPYAHTQAMTFAQHFLPNGGVEKNGSTGGGLMARYQRAASDALTWRIGADVDVASGWLKEIQPEPFGFFPGDGRFPQGKHYDYTVDTLMGALWGELDYALTEDMHVVAGLRAEAHEYDYSTDVAPGINGRFNVPADRTDTFELLTPKLGVIWSVADAVDLYANYARGQRAPQASDLYRLQSLQVAGQVKEETLDSIEIGARGSALQGRLLYDVSAYWMEKENFFFRDSDGLNVPDGSTEHKGVEVTGAFELTPVLSLSGAASWSDQTYTFDRIVGSGTETIRDGNEIDTAPEWLANVSLDWQATNALKLSLNVDHVGEYYVDPANTTVYPGHTVLGARGSWAFSDTAEVFLIVRNLTDERYADRADLAFGNDRYFPGEPVNATLGMRKRF
ncbi:MAG: TonB-dependent receptor [Alphaproteobacteria bacterium]|nr:TonB-dependent receptor [Hyphomonas sp.]MBR9807100.1 TonB-dependent receptor [Alphaproteobacteria bacterium]|tara:strand:- start:558 stop:2636 length:2079 start_codon:yes stop_codon:yes gene_type:complete